MLDRSLAGEEPCRLVIAAKGRLREQLTGQVEQFDRARIDDRHTPLGADIAHLIAFPLGVALAKRLRG